MRPMLMRVARNTLLLFLIIIGYLGRFVYAYKYVFRVRKSRILSSGASSSQEQEVG